MARPKRREFQPRLLEHRRRLGLTQEEVAEKLALSVEMIRRHERGLSMPKPPNRTAYSALYGESAERLGLCHPSLGLPYGTTTKTAMLSTVPVDSDDMDGAGAPEAEVIHEHVKHLVALDNAMGGGELAPVAARLFKEVRHRIGRCANRDRNRKDTLAAMGELAEVGGWLAFDAERHSLVRLLNQEALYYTRLSGNREIELLTLQNMSMHDVELGQPAAALDIAESVLQSPDHLSARVRSLFLIRKARAIARAGGVEALDLMDHAWSLFREGVGEADPDWAWWIDEREIEWHVAMCRVDLDDLNGALSAFERSVDAGPPGVSRSNFVHRAYLLRAQAAVQSWDAVDETLSELAQLAEHVASNRARGITRAVIDEVSSASKSSPRLRALRTKAAAMAARFDEEGSIDAGF